MLTLAELKLTIITQKVVEIKVRNIHSTDGGSLEVKD